MPRYKVGSDTYTIPEDNTEAIEVMKITYPNASVLADDPEDDTNKLDDYSYRICGYGSSQNRSHDVRSCR